MRHWLKFLDNTGWGVTRMADDLEYETLKMKRMQDELNAQRRRVKEMEGSALKYVSTGAECWPEEEILEAKQRAKNYNSKQRRTRRQ